MSTKEAKLRGLLQTLQEGVKAVHAEQREFERDRDKVASLTADIESRTAATRPDSGPFAGLLYDRQILLGWQIWLGYRPARQAAAGQELASNIRHAGDVLRQLEGPEGCNNFLDLNLASGQDALQHAKLALERIESMLQVEVSK